jgi:hypothetical protein
MLNRIYLKERNAFNNVVSGIERASMKVGPALLVLLVPESIAFFRELVEALERLSAEFGLEPERLQRV